MRARSARRRGPHRRARVFAFTFLALNSLLLKFLNLPREYVGWVYLLRLGAFALIIAAIVHKSTSAHKAR